MMKMKVTILSFLGLISFYVIIIITREREREKEKRRTEKLLRVSNFRIALDFNELSIKV